MAPPEQSPQNQVGREAIHLVAYDARWPAAYEAEHQRLLSLFPLQLRAVEHIGSTAIPGMPAKPIVDVLAGVDSMAVADGMFEPVLSNGYTTSRAFNEMLPRRPVVHAPVQWSGRFSRSPRTLPRSDRPDSNRSAAGR